MIFLGQYGQRRTAGGLELARQLRGIELLADGSRRGRSALQFAEDPQRLCRARSLSRSPQSLAQGAGGWKCRVLFCEKGERALSTALDETGAHRNQDLLQMLAHFFVPCSWVKLE
jgi:hypothetical protein